MNKGTKLNELFGKKEPKNAPPPADPAATAAKEDPADEEIEAAPANAGDKPAGEPEEKDAKATDKVEGDKTDADPYAEWTKEDLVKEMKTTRSEAANARVAKKALEEQLNKEYEQRLKTLEEKYTPLIEKAKELDTLKDKEADKKRSLEEKIAHRETTIEELQGKLQNVEDKYREEKVALQSEKERAQEEVKAYETYWKEQLDKELNDIPEKFKKTADLLVKGAGGTRAALEEIRSAKKEGMFSTKSVKVFNATPGAKDGARTDTDKEKAAQKKNLSTMQKIGKGLQDWRTAKTR